MARDRVGGRAHLERLLARSQSQPSYSNIDARLTSSDADKRYRVIAYVANATDNETVNGLAAGSTVNGQPVQNFLLNPPRTYGLSLYYYFGSDRR